MGVIHPPSADPKRPQPQRIRRSDGKRHRATANPWTKAKSDPRWQVSWLAGHRSVHAFPEPKFQWLLRKNETVHLARRSQLQGQPRFSSKSCIPRSHFKLLSKYQRDHVRQSHGRSDRLSCKMCKLKPEFEMMRSPPSSPMLSGLAPRLLWWPSIMQEGF